MYSSLPDQPLDAVNVIVMTPSRMPVPSCVGICRAFRAQRRMLFFSQWVVLSLRQMISWM
jgi:hypothetical protein